MQFRARTRNGKNSIVKLDESSATIQDLRDAIIKNVDDTKDGFTLSFGFPPQTVNLDAFTRDQTLSDAGLKLNNESVQVIPVVTGQKNPFSPAPPISSKAGSSSTSTTNPRPPGPTSANPKQTTQTKTRPPPAASPAPMTDQDVPSVPLLAQSSSLTLRIMPDDNSCLFRAIAAAIHPSSSDDYVSILRYQVASYVTANPTSYPKPVLDGRTPDAYAAWIQQESSWGGDVELDVLSRVLGIEIWCCQVDPFFVRKYNESEGSGEFIVLVYSGIHYDTVALSPSIEDMVPAEFDIRKFSGGDDTSWVQDATKALCEKLKARGYMTNTSNFGVMCKVEGCGWVGQGEKAAVEHAKTTGHTDLEEIT